MQQFQDNHWVWIDMLIFILVTTPSLNSLNFMTMSLNNKDDDLVNITLDLSFDKWVSYYGLNRQAINVYPATSQKLRLGKKLDFKFYWGKVSHVSEAVTLDRVKNIMKSDPDIIFQINYFPTNFQILPQY